MNFKKLALTILLASVPMAAQAEYITHTLDCTEDGGPKITVFNDHRIKINDGSELFAGNGVGNNGGGYNYVSDTVRAFLNKNCVIRSSHSATCSIKYTSESNQAEALPYVCNVQDKN